MSSSVRETHIGPPIASGANHFRSVAERQQTYFAQPASLTKPKRTKSKGKNQQSKQVAAPGWGQPLEPLETPSGDATDATAGRELGREAPKRKWPFL